MRMSSRARKSMLTKVLVAVLALALCTIFAVGGTIAWLTANTDPVVNTFTYGDINIKLDESDDLDLKMVPGKVITKDPVVTVKADSEACWLFVKVEESENFEDFMTYTMADGWTALADNDGVYYCEVTASDADQEFAVIADNEVTVKGTVTKTDLNALTADTYPTLTFTAYAVQKENVSSAAAAWAIANPTPASGT